MSTINRREFVRVGAVAALAAAESDRAHAHPATALPSPANTRFQNTPAGRTILIDAKPTPISLDTAKSAVVVVDMQNDFGSEGGMFHRAGIDISMIQRAVGPTARVLASAREEGMKVVYLKMAFRPDLSDAGPPDAPNRRRHLLLGVGKKVRAPNGTESRVLIRDTWNTDILPELMPRTEDLVVYKHRFSGFFQTDLDATLKKQGIRSLIVTGCTTSVCVESTIRDAMFRDYSCVLLADCTGEPIGHEFARSNHDASLLVIERLFGWVSSSEAFTGALAARPVTATEAKR
jgi:ureidoacrylate peracid hydrolase